MYYRTETGKQCLLSLSHNVLHARENNIKYYSWYQWKDITCGWTHANHKTLASLLTHSQEVGQSQIGHWPEASEFLSLIRRSQPFWLILTTGVTSVPLLLSTRQYVSRVPSWAPPGQHVHGGDSSLILTLSFPFTLTLFPWLHSHDICEGSHPSPHPILVTSISDLWHKETN